MADMNEIAREWLAARNVIAEIIRELVPLTRAAAEHNAAAIIARLAHHKPPILLRSEDQTETDRLRVSLENMLEFVACDGMVDAKYDLQAPAALRAGVPRPRDQGASCPLKPSSTPTSTVSAITSSPAPGSCTRSGSSRSGQRSPCSCAAGGITCAAARAKIRGGWLERWRV